MELSSSKIKKFLIFPEMQLSSFIFFSYFRKELSKFEKSKKTTLKKFLIFREIKIFLPQAQKTLIFQEGTLKPQT